MKEMLIEGKSIDEAIENACRVFGVPREKLNIEIVSEGSSGFLGIGAKKVQIRASLLTLDLMIDVPLVRQSVEPEAVETLVHESAREKARRILEGLLMRMQVDAPVNVEETEEAIILNIQGNGSGFLIGKQGQNLDAMQYIVSKAVHHSVDGHKMIIVDTEGYRERRKQSLIAMALRIGEKAKKTKKPLTIGYMNAHDRRVIHMALQDDEALTTKSRGEGEYRKILILPVRHSREPADG
ncbi:MAG: KH domain-containing protein [Deltaproteobacteria bacterium]|nr:KH domain-containing protein [Deltaproteobacteria bacterium]